MLLPSNRLSKASNKAARSTWLDVLPYDVVCVVFAHLEWPYDFHRLASTSRILNEWATPYLYKRIVIAYLAPQQTLRMLTKLESDPQLCGQVKTLVFDDKVKIIGPRIPSIDDFDAIRSSELENRNNNPPLRLNSILSHVHHKLYSLIPSLYNIRSVYLNRPHPAFLSPPLDLHPPPRPLSVRLREAVPSELSRKRTKGLSTYGFNPDEAPNAIALFLTHCAKLEELVIFCPRSLKSFWTPSLVGHLTTIAIGLNLDSVVVELDVMDVRATLWNGILRRASGLRTLAMTNTWVSLGILLEGCHFPHLEAIEWFGFRQKDPGDPAVFLDFLKKHPTVQCLALSPVAYIIGNWGYVVNKDANWLDPCHTDLLPNLQTLRLHNWEAYSSPQPVYEISPSAKRATAIQICQFLRNRTSITDVAITSLPPNLARILSDELIASRPMRHVLMGQEERQSRIAHVPQFPPPPNAGATAQWTFRRKADYLREAWEAYEVVFKGLTLERSGWRPYLLPKNPKARRTYSR